MSAFDREAHLRSRVRRAEARATFLGGELDRAVRLIALLARTAAGQDVDPAALVAIAESIEDHAETCEWWTPERVVTLLRETTPETKQPELVTA